MNTHQYASMRNLAGRNATAATELVQWAADRHLTLEPIELDVTDERSISAAIDAIELHRPLDVLVNNAGVMPTGLTEALP